MLQEWFKVHDSAIATLYHYTTTNGLCGILGSNSLWASHIGYLNDRSELEHARGLILSLLEHTARKEGDAVVSRFLEQAETCILQTEANSNYFISCFCEEPDLLSQWRAYSNGGGFAIGFDAPALARVARPSIDLALRRVIYDVDIQKFHVSKVLTRTIALLRKVSYGASEAAADDLSQTFSSFLVDHLIEHQLCFKNPLFASENEWRLILRFSSQDYETLLQRIQFRPGQSVIVPYVALDIPVDVGRGDGRLPIQRVIYGPTLDVDLAKRSVKQLADKCGYRDLEHWSSAVPLRG